MAAPKTSLTQGETINEALYIRFKDRAEELTVTVLRAPSGREAVELILEQLRRLNLKRLVSPPLTLVEGSELEKKTAALGVEYSTRLERKTIEQADIGISEFHLGIAELGTLVQDASSLHTRLVSMLPPVHLALLPTTALVESFPRALEAIEKAYPGEIPPYLSFITGPSKTADIERQLTIGVHGPETVIILFIDNLSA